MPRTALERFLTLLTIECGEHVFNPWRERDAPNDGALNSPAARLGRLRAHLDVDAERVLVGEASGYQGCHISGIPFTSERVILVGEVPRVTADAERLSLRHIPWSEPSATTVWGTLHTLGIAETTVLWNAFPWHPHEPARLQSNRTPSHSERAEGLAVLEAMLRVFPQAQLLAVGRHAEMALQSLGYAATPLRHPSMGGARRFSDGLRAAVQDSRRTAQRKRAG